MSTNSDRPPGYVPLRWAVMLFLAMMLAVTSAPARAKPILPTGVELPVTVHVSLKVLDLVALNNTNGVFTAQVELAQRWQDPNQSFDALALGQNRKTYVGDDAREVLETIWTPVLAFQNLTGPIEVINPALSIASDGQIALVQRMQAEFRARIDMTQFPFDRQTLPFVLRSERYSQDEVVLVSTRVDEQFNGFSAFFTAAEWLPNSLVAVADRAMGWNSRPVSTMTMRLAIDRNWGQLLVRLFIPFMAVMCAPIFILWVPSTLIHPYVRVQMTFAALLALAAVSFTFEANFPGSLSMNSPVAMMVSIGYIFPLVVVIIDLTVIMNQERITRHYPYLQRELRRNLRVSAPIIFLGLCALSFVVLTPPPG